MVNKYNPVEEAYKLLVPFMSATDNIDSSQLLVTIEEAVGYLGEALDDNTKIPAKFKDADALVKAYKSLEADYTRKCQKLKELQDKMSSGEGEADTYHLETVYFPGKAIFNHYEGLASLHYDPVKDQTVVVRRRRATSDETF